MDRTNLQTILTEISCDTNHYSSFNETTFVIVTKIPIVDKSLFPMGKNTVEGKKWLVKHYADSAPGKSTVTDWYDKFKSGPISMVVPQNIKKIHKIVLENRKVKLREIANTLKISEGRVFKILHENLSMRKLLSKRMRRLLTPDQKQQCINDSQFGAIQAK